MVTWHKPPIEGTQTAFPIPSIREARLTSFQIRLVSETKLKRIQRRQFRELQAKIFNLWQFVVGVYALLYILCVCNSFFLFCRRVSRKFH